MRMIVLLVSFTAFARRLSSNELKLMCLAACSLEGHGKILQYRVASKTAVFAHGKRVPCLSQAGELLRAGGKRVAALRKAYRCTDCLLSYPPSSLSQKYLGLSKLW